MPRISRQPEAVRQSPQGPRPESRLAVPGPYIEADRGGNRCRAARAIPDASLFRAIVPLWKTKNAIGVLNGAQPVRDYDRRCGRCSSRSSASRIIISVFVSTLDVASSRIRNVGLCASARAKLTNWRWPTESVAPRSVTSVCHSAWQRANEIGPSPLPRMALSTVARSMIAAQADV